MKYPTKVPTQGPDDPNHGPGAAGARPGDPGRSVPHAAGARARRIPAAFSRSTLRALRLVVLRGEVPPGNHLSYENLRDWVEDRLSWKQQASFRSHLDHCPACANQLADLALLRTDLVCESASTAPGALPATARGDGTLWAWLRCIAVPALAVLVVALVAAFGMYRRDIAAQRRTEREEQQRCIAAVRQQEATFRRQATTVIASLRQQEAMFRRQFAAQATRIGDQQRLAAAQAARIRDQQAQLAGLQQQLAWHNEQLRLAQRQQLALQQERQRIINAAPSLVWAPDPRRRTVETRSPLPGLSQSAPVSSGSVQQQIAQAEALPDRLASGDGAHEPTSPQKGTHYSAESLQKILWKFLGYRPEHSPLG